MKVLVFGSFDYIHPGHIDFFKQAKKFGTKLIVVVARDQTIKDVKNIEPKFSEQERLNQVKSQKEVDEAYLGNPDNKYDIIEKIKPDIICLGYDQTSFTQTLSDELVKRNISAKIIRLKPHKPEIYKSSIMKKNNK